MVPQIVVVIIMGGRICHPCWVSNRRSMVYLSNFQGEFICGFQGESIARVCHVGVW